MVKYVKLITLCFLLFTPQWVSAGASASLDRQISTFGESVLLSIKVDESVDEEPDFSVLEQGFDILNQSQSSSYSVVNGSFSRSKQWQLNLMPKRMGMIEIPEISFGNIKTQRLSLRVLDPKQATTAHQTKDIFLEVIPSTDKVYVQAQLLLTVKLFRAVNLSQAELSEPELQQSVVKKLGKDQTYETVVNQRRFIVTERKYAVFTAQVGALNIPALQFDGRVVAAGRGVFAQQAGRTVRVLSEPIKVQVLAKPDVWDKIKPWLPARALSLRELWTDGQSTTYKVGELLTRTIELRGTGLTAAHLPALFKTEEVEGFKQYPDQPILHSEVGEDGLVGIRREKAALIPTKAGELILPGASVSWWNTETESIQTMLIPDRVIEVLPTDKAAGESVDKTMVEESGNKAEIDSVGEEQVELVTVQEDNWWKVLTLLFALSWLLTVALWWYTARQKELKKKNSGPVEKALALKLKPVQKALETACKLGDAEKVIKLLPQWGALFFEDKNLSQLNQLKGKSKALDAELSALEKHLYGQGEQSTWSGEKMLQAITEVKPEQTKQVKNTGLKTLYP